MTEEWPLLAPLAGGGSSTDGGVTSSIILGLCGDVDISSSITVILAATTEVRGRLPFLNNTKTCYVIMHAICTRQDCQLATANTKRVASFTKLSPRVVLEALKLTLQAHVSSNQAKEVDRQCRRKVP